MIKNDIHYSIKGELSENSDNFIFINSDKELIKFIEEKSK